MTSRQASGSATPVGPVPLTPAQQAIWAQSQAAADCTLYNALRCMRLRGPIDVLALRWSIDQLVGRHESLRTVFHPGPAVTQAAAPPSGAELAVLDAGQGPSGDPRDPESRAMALALEEFRRPFDLAKGPLFRATLIRISAGEHLLLLVLHHMVIDAWSFAVLARDLTVLYAARAEGRTPDLPQQPLQYGDYARRLAAGRGADASNQGRRMRDALAGVPGVVDLPTDRPRPPVPSHRGGLAYRSAPPTLSAAVRGLCAAAGVTRFSVLHAAFAALVGHWAGSERFGIGTMLAGRPWPEVQEVVGLFSNVVVLPADLSGDPTFAQLTRRVQRVVATSLDQWAIPFRDLAEALGRDDDLARIPLLQLRHQHKETGTEEWVLPGLRIEWMDLDIGLTKSDLSLFTIGDGDRLDLVMGYSLDLFDTATARWLLTEYCGVLERLAGSPDTPLSRIGLARPRRQPAVRR